MAWRVKTGKNEHRLREKTRLEFKGLVVSGRHEVLKRFLQNLKANWLLSWDICLPQDVWLAGQISCLCFQMWNSVHQGVAGTDSGEVKWANFHDPFSEPPSFFFSYPSNIEIIFDFSDIITKFTPHFKILDPPLMSFTKELLLNVFVHQYLVKWHFLFWIPCSWQVVDACFKNIYIWK